MSWLIHRELNSIDPNVEDEDQETPLFLALRNGKLTPLHGVSENGHERSCYSKGNADVIVKYAWTLLHLASASHSKKLRVCHDLFLFLILLVLQWS